MPRPRRSIDDKERSPLQYTQSPLGTAAPGYAGADPPHTLSPASHNTPLDHHAQYLPTYSQTILQASILAIDSSTLPRQSFSPGPPSISSRRQSSASMRTASMTYENITPSSTPTGRISKAKKGKRVHACEFHGCGKVFTRAEHKRRHELNHNPESVFKCVQPGCNKAFHRMDLLQRHQERHDLESSPTLEHAGPHHANTFSPPLTMFSSNLANTQADASQRNSQAPLSIGSLVHPQHHHYQQFTATETSLGYPSLFVTAYPQTMEPYYYGSEGSHSPVSEHLVHYHRPSISSSSSVAGGIDAASISPVMTSSMLGTWVPAPLPPPTVLPSGFEEGQTSYVPSPTVNPMPLHLRPELDGVEFATIQRELSNVPGLIFDSARPELPRYIRSDCLEHYWQYFHPSFPIVYKPNFVTNTPPPLLLSAVLAIGSYFDSRPDARQYSLALQEIATRLLRQRQNITSKSRNADLQTVLLLEIFSKYYSRHALPETSPRFRHLFVSLQQSRHTVVQNPLAVYKTLQAEKTTNDLKRAHKFWLQHETRRRIFHACAVLDSQQVILFSQKATVVAPMNDSTMALDKQIGNYLPCDESLWEAGSLKDWSERASLHVPYALSTARSEYGSKVVGDYSFFQHQIINTHPSMVNCCSDEVQTPPKKTMDISKTSFNYHVFRMARHTPIQQLLIVTGESWVLGRKVKEEIDYEQAKKVVRDWMTTGPPSLVSATSSSLIAFWHALKVLRMITNVKNSSTTFHTTNMLHEDWSIYLSVLICWAHWYAVTTMVRLRTKHLQQRSSQATPVPSSRKRKNTEVQISTKKQRLKMSTGCGAMSAPPTAAFTSQTHSPMPTNTSLIAEWHSYNSVSPSAEPWAKHYDDTQTNAYAAALENPTAADGSVYASSVTYTANTRTATNTPHSCSSRATTVIPLTSMPMIDSRLVDLSAYLSSTDVSNAELLAHLDPETLDKTKSVLDAVRVYKIGGKRILGGLMNEAERVLARLIENKRTDMF